MGSEKGLFFWQTTGMLTQGDPVVCFSSNFYLSKKILNDENPPKKTNKPI